jgi:hypothetical protein
VGVRVVEVVVHSLDYSSPVIQYLSGDMSRRGTFLSLLVVAVTALLALFTSASATTAATSGKTPLAVTWDGRSFLFNGKRELLVGGSIHYPRAPRSEWRLDRFSSLCFCWHVF